MSSEHLVRLAPHSTRAMGIAWDRHRVHWDDVPRLYGQRRHGGSVVDFAEQEGVYLLCNGTEILYVGCTRGRNLGISLAHQTDGWLGDQWTTFTWFGLHPVNGDGCLEVDPRLAGNAGALIGMLEVVLIRQSSASFPSVPGLERIDFVQADDPFISPPPP
jgi:hypothetical protein